MTTLANTVKLGNLPTYRFGLDTYNPDALGLGELMVQKSGLQPEDNFGGPFPLKVIRPMEASVAVPYAYPWAMRWSEATDNQWDWVFMADNATAAATRRLGMARLDRLTGDFTYDGFLTVTFPGTSEAKTLRALRMSYEKHTVGTVDVSGTAVTGTSTKFQTDRPCVGNRIGFGSTDPAQITQWYEISAIASDTGLTLTTTAGTITAGTPYVIEDLRAYLIATSVTTSLGGLYVVKGLRRELFSPAGGAVPAATTVDSIRACYFLKDASTGTALAAFGGGMEDTVNFTTRHFWQAHTLANPILQKYNVYAALTLTAGAATNALVFITGAGGAVTGTTSQLNNGRVAKPSHGPGNGIDCFYFTTTTRVYRSVQLSAITAAQAGWIIDSMTEVPPGGLNTFAAGGGIQSIEYSGVLDRFLITTTGAAGIRSYITQYRTDGGQFDRIIFSDNKQIDQGTADSTITPQPCPLALPFSCWIEGGVLYAARVGTTAAINQVYCIPIGVDWEYITTSGARLVLPRIPTPGADRYLQAFFSDVSVIGGATGKNLGMGPEPYRTQYRTSGIVDNSGSWSPLDDTRDISGISGADYIQFRVEFRMSNTLIPARILNAGVTYEAVSTDSHFMVSDKSNPATKQFVWWFASAFGGTVPTLKVRIYDAISKSVLVNDLTVGATGTWEKSTDGGGTWGAYNSTDRGNTTTYLRYTPASIADDVVVQPVLSVA